MRPKAEPFDSAARPAWSSGASATVQLSTSELVDYTIIMRLFRHGASGSEQIGIVDETGVHRDASSFGEDYGEAFFATDGLLRLSESSVRESSKWPVLDPDGIRFGPPIARPSKLIGIGLNYRDHAVETGARLPSEPKIFMKATTALGGINDDVPLPPGAEQLDHEVELAVVIGRLARRIPVESALDHVAGYTMCNDYSERNWQKNREGQFVKGKSADGFAPLGPYLVTPDEVAFEDTRLWCSVNGEMRQDARTSAMVFPVQELIASLSQYMTLLPGDVITTGTPSGVGLGRTPPVFLRSGDVVRLGIEGIGEGAQTILAIDDR